MTPQAQLDIPNAVMPPTISVIVPVRNDERNLLLCLAALRSSSPMPMEIIVIDDGSDSAVSIAGADGVHVVRLARHVGPSIARNRGAHRATGEILLFIDADCCVHPDTIGRVTRAFEADSTIDALFGSYDVCPAAPNFVSQYRNLFHHFVHQNSREEAATFWTGCGAIRRSIFMKSGGFDEDRHAIEDIELGIRLHESGRRILLRKEIQVTHLKAWNISSMLRCDFCVRAVPWTRLILLHRSLPSDLNLANSQRLSAGLAAAMLATLVIGGCFTPLLWALPILALMIVMVVDFAGTKGRDTRLVSGCAASVLATTAVAILACSGEMGIAPAALLAAVVIANIQLYAFYIRHRGASFAVLVIPLHLAYYLYSSTALACGIAAHFWETAIRSSSRQRANVPLS